MVIGVWCYASVFAVGPLVHWGSFGPEPYGTACCINWYTPSHDALAMSYIISLFIFCYVVPCTIIILSYTFILVTVRGSQQAVQQHVSPQTKVTNAHALIVKLSVAVCIGFLTAWSPYAIVAMWAAFSANEQVPPTAFALAAIMAKSSTIYNPMVYLLFKPNFRKSLSQDTQMFRHRICLSHSKASPSPGMKDQERQSSQQCNNKDGSISTPFSSGQAESYGACHVYAEAGPHYQQISRQITARVLEGSVQSEIPVKQLTEKMQNDLL
ncbi:opsin 7, group member c isoform X1 [Danio rerio]